MSNSCAGGDLFDGSTCTVHAEVVSILWIMGLAVSIACSAYMGTRLHELISRAHRNFAVALRQSASSRAVVLCMTQAATFTSLGCMKLAGQAVGADTTPTILYGTATLAAQLILGNSCWGWVLLVQKTPVMRGRQSATATHGASSVLSAGCFVAAVASYAPLGFCFTDNPAAKVGLFVAHVGGIAASLLSTGSVMLFYGHQIVYMLREAVDGELRRQSSFRVTDPVPIGRSGASGARKNSLARSLSLRLLPDTATALAITSTCGSPPRRGNDVPLSQSLTPSPGSTRSCASGVTVTVVSPPRLLDNLPQPLRALRRSHQPPSPLQLFVLGPGTESLRHGERDGVFVVTVDGTASSPAGSCSDGEPLGATPLSLAQGSTPRRTKLRRTLVRFQAFRALVLASLAVNFAAYATMAVWAPLRAQFTYVIPVVGILSLVLSCVSVGVLAFTAPGPSPRAAPALPSRRPAVTRLANRYGQRPPGHNPMTLSSGRRGMATRTKSVPSCFAGRHGASYARAASFAMSDSPSSITPEDVCFAAQQQHPAPTSTLSVRDSDCRGGHWHAGEKRVAVLEIAAVGTTRGGHAGETNDAAVAASELAKSPMLAAHAAVV